MSIEIANESGAEVDTDAVLDCARFALDEMGVNPLAELSVLLVDVPYMAELNHRWMGGDGPTDVLAFPMEEGTIDPGPTTCPAANRRCSATWCSVPRWPRSRRSASATRTADELHMLTVHGVLHLLGYDHAEPDEEREMFSLQAKLLDSWRAARRG